MSYGFQQTSGTQRVLTLRDKLQQIVNLGQPQIINNIPIKKDIAEVLLSGSDEKIDFFFGFCSHFKIFKK